MLPLFINYTVRLAAPSRAWFRLAQVKGGLMQLDMPQTSRNLSVTWAHFFKDGCGSVAIALTSFTNVPLSKSKRLSPQRIGETGHILISEAVQVITPGSQLDLSAPTRVEEIRRSIQVHLRDRTRRLDTASASQWSRHPLDTSALAPEAGPTSAPCFF